MTHDSTAPDAETLALAHKLFDAARQGDSGLLAGYLAAGVPATLTNEAGDTLLMLAAYHGHADTVRLILQHGGDANSANDRGQTPLAGAVFKGYTGGGAGPAGRRRGPRRRHALSARRGADVRAHGHPGPAGLSARRPASARPHQPALQP